MDTVAASTDQAEPKTVQDFLDYIENQELFHVLITVDRLKEKVQNDVWIAVFMQRLSEKVNSARKLKFHTED